MKRKMHHYLFVFNDETTVYDGEEFLVGAYSLEEAWEIIDKEIGEFLNIEFEEIEMTDEEAEESGLDEY